MQENFKGTIREITFQNEENGYTIAVMITNDKQAITIVGYLPALFQGESLEIEGKWINHPTYGAQVEVLNFIPTAPESLAGILAYLSSGIIKGIGEKTAEKIVDKFGKTSIEVLEENPEKLTQIEGIGPKKARKISESFKEDRKLRNIILNLCSMGISIPYAMKIYKQYKDQSISIVKENPYKLAEEIKGIGFKIADNLGQKLGIDPLSPHRISQGIIHVLKEASLQGHTFLKIKDLIKRSVKLLKVEKERIEIQCRNLALEQKIQLENLEEEKVYLVPYYIAENGVCRKLIELSREEIDPLDLNFEESILEIENDKKIELAKNQKLAVKESLNKALFILTGGPGTGKTTTINTIIEIFEKAKKKVLLAAPTGRAAKRMSETTNKEAKTIHRLLEIGYQREEEEMVFAKDEDSQIEADVIILDEVSMVDILLMYNFLKAVKPKTRVIFVGDQDQLPSVGAGNVLKDMIDSKMIPVVRLNEIFRQAKESMIVVNAHKINVGEIPILNAKGKDFYFIERKDNDEILKEVLSLASKRLPKFYKADPIKDIQILSPMRKSELGVNELNIKLQEILNPASEYKVEEKFQKRVFRVGDKVMQIKNNYSKAWEDSEQKLKGEGVFNGDMGYVYHIDKKENIIYIIYDDYKIAKYDYSELDEIDHSYCTTIHKSQGSEFDYLILPMSWAPPMLLTRNLLYTAITRAKKLVVIVGDPRFMKQMIKNNKIEQRNSSLEEKLKKFLQEGLIIDESEV